MIKDPSGTSVASKAEGKLCHKLLEEVHIAAGLDKL
jgi:hypothetical protein